MIRVRPHHYRGADGWLIYGKRDPESAWPVSIFCENERAARRIAIKVQAGGEVTTEDFSMFDGVAA